LLGTAAGEAMLAASTDGGLMAHGPNMRAIFDRAAGLADGVGYQPGDPKSILVRRVTKQAAE
jgi:hypothetical protein